MEIAITALISYLLGSIPFAVFIAKAAKIGDITKYGSGNPGATNMARMGGKKLAALNLLLDAGKGALAVYIGMQLGCPHTAFIAVVLGHCYSVFLKFRGGKGVATTLGALLFANFHVGITICILWLIAFAIFRISSIAALIAINMTVLKVLLWYGTTPLFWTLLFINLLITFQHGKNIKKLLEGTED